MEGLRTKVNSQPPLLLVYLKKSEIVKGKDLLCRKFEFRPKSIVVDV